MGVVRKPGRPTVLTKSRWETAIIEAERGLPLAAVAAVMGVNRRTLYRWLERGDADPKSRWGKFALEYRAARAKDCGEILDMQKTHAAEHPKSAEWRLKVIHKVGASTHLPEALDDLVEYATDEDRLKAQLQRVQHNIARAEDAGSWQALARLEGSYDEMSQRLALVQARNAAESTAGLSPEEYEVRLKGELSEWPDQFLELAARVYRARHKLADPEVVGPTAEDAQDALNKALS